MQGDVSAAFQDFVAAFENSPEHASILAGCGHLPGKFKGRGKTRLIPSLPSKFTASVNGTLLTDQRVFVARRKVVQQFRDLVFGFRSAGVFNACLQQLW